jgi:acetyl/propionyl-CoA carboxylase alpha subunit
MPAGPGVRVDTAAEPGDRVPPDYDPLVAKLLVVDVDRPSAIARLGRALDEVEITGIQTTLPFHRFVAAHEGFGAGDLSTGWVADEWDPAAAEIRQRALDIAATVAAAAGGTASPTAPTTPTGPQAADLPGGWALAAREDAIDRWPR